VHADRDVLAYGGDGGAGVATRSLPVADGVVHLRDGVGGHEDLSRRHPDVWQATDAARDAALAKVQLIVRVYIDEEKSLRWVHKISNQQIRPAATFLAYYKDPRPSPFFQRSDRSAGPQW
jgi:hypothetical protein